MRRRSRTSGKSKIVHKGKSGYVEMRTIIPKAEEKVEELVQKERYRSRETRARKKIVKPKLAPQQQYQRMEYFPLSEEQSTQKGRWMANEDCNIWMYIAKCGFSGHKK